MGERIKESLEAAGKSGISLVLLGCIAFLLSLTIMGCSITSIADEAAVAADKASLQITFAPGDSAESATGNLTLPTAGQSGTSISWSSDTPSVVSTAGVVTRPTTNTMVNLTATIVKRNASDNKAFAVTVIASISASNANLAGLTISQGSLSPAFSSSVTNYTTSVANSITTVTVTPSTEDVAATIQVRINSGSWQSVPSGSASGSLGLIVGSNIIDVTVTAADAATTKNYRITITRGTASADLSALTTSEGSLSPAFSPSVSNYSTSLPYILSTITVTATVAEAGATIQVRSNGGSWQGVLSGFASGPLSLNVGSNLIEVVVTAADGVTIKGYAISVVRREGGALDTSFINSTVTMANAIVLQPNGKIVVGGSVSSSSGVIRLNSDGSFDTSILGSTAFGSVTVKSLAVQSDGKILIGGNFYYNNGAGHYDGYNLIRANSDGTRDWSFLGNGGGPNGTVMSVAIQGDQILIGGNMDVYRYGLSPTTINFMARLNSDSTLDTSFWPTANGIGPDWTVNTVVLNGGYIYIGGAYSSYAGWRGGVTRLYSNGVYDIPGPGFMVDDTLGSNGVRSLAVQPDGKTIIGGDFTTYWNISRHSIIRINSDGTLDSPFGISADGANGSVYAIALQPDGKILIGGDFTMYNGSSRNHIARLNTDGSLDISFLTTGSGTDGTVCALAVQTDGKILIGGAFSLYNGVACSGIVRVLED